jgi:4-amino-4-deoxy-L-arabinose transferase-like glycosyltransferase
MNPTTPHASPTIVAPRPSVTGAGVKLQSEHRTALMVLVGLWLALFVAALFAPSLLDDADSTHASAARHIVLSGDWVTLHVNGIRYLEKAPLPYWLVAICFKLFGFNTFAAHLPQAIGVLLLALLGYRWGVEASGPRTALYTGMAILTSAGVFLFTRVFIPEVLLSLLLAIALYCLLHALPRSGKNGGSTLHAYVMWTSLALAVLTKGLVALVFFFGTAILYLALTDEYKKWRTLKPFTGSLLFLVIAAPWHILAGLRNTGGMNGHGFFWFYFINEHLLRFLGKRIPMDYNKLPGYLYWSLHLVWLFPWALFLGVLVRQAYVAFQRYRASNPPPAAASPYNWQLYATVVVGLALQNIAHIPYLFTVFVALMIFLLNGLRRRQANAPENTPLLQVPKFAQRTTVLLAIFSSMVLVFFSLSTNQEYYTFPAYLPILMLMMAALVRAEESFAIDPDSRRWITVAHATLTVIGVAVAVTLAYGLWSSRHLPFVPDIGDLLAHRGVGDYTLSMSHLFDLTGPSFAALRLPAILAALAFAFGPAIAWLLRQQRRHLASTAAIALTASVFLIAAHIALIRFGPMLSSRDLAEKIQELEDDGNIASDRQIILYGDQSYGSSIPFYLGEPINEPLSLVDGRSSSMLFGSTFADAPKIFLEPADLLAMWGNGRRKVLFVPLEKRDDVDRLLGDRKILIEETSGKALFTDRPLEAGHLRTNVHAKITGTP